MGAVRVPGFGLGSIRQRWAGGGIKNYCIYYEYSKCHYIIFTTIEEDEWVQYEYLALVLGAFGSAGQAEVLRTIVYCY